MELNITKFFTETCPRDYQASVAEIGADGRAWRITGCTGCWSAYANVTKSGSINQLLMYDRLGEISVQLESIK